MSPDAMALLIAAAGGAVCASLVWLVLCGLSIARTRCRASKEAWAAARRFYLARFKQEQGA